MSNLIPRYVVSEKILNGWWFIWRVTDVTVIHSAYRTEHAAEAVANTLNQWAGQEGEV